MARVENIGMNGEKEVVSFLIKNAYKILSTNWRFKHKEIDIIAVKDGLLCVVEVKTRSTNYTSPKDAVTKAKQRNLIIAANAYIDQKELDYEVRFDVAEVFLENNNYRINYIEGAFIPLI